MGPDNISYASILSLGLFLLVIFWFNRHLKIRLTRRMVFAIVRMVIQLSLVGLFLQYVFNLNNPALNLLYLTLMVAVAGISAVKACDVPMGLFLFPVALSFFLVNGILLVFFNAFVIRIDQIFDARYMVTIGGMLLGNCLTGNIIAINSFYKAIEKSRKEYLYTLSLCGNRKEAQMPFFKSAVQDAVNPTVASIETIGLVSLPGMMTGQMLGGAVPMTAIKYQIAIMAAILISRYLGAILTLFLTAARAFDGYDILRIRRKNGM